MSKLMRLTRTDLHARAHQHYNALPYDVPTDIRIPIERLIHYHAPTKVMLISAIEVIDYVRKNHAHT